MRDRLGMPEKKPAQPNSAPSTTGSSAINSKSSPAEKVKLFRSLFRGREDVYAVRWEGRNNGKAGYSPAHRRVWGVPHTEQPKEYFPLTNQVIHDHLTGKLTAGVYPLLTNETCWFLAADFDKATWLEDVRAFLHTCDEWQVPAVLERSRSGGGGHVWIFFEAPLPASLCPQAWCGHSDAHDGAAASTWPRLLRPILSKPGYDAERWFAAFAVWIAARATSRKGKTGGAAADLFREAKVLLAGADKCRPQLDRQKAQALHDQLRNFQERTPEAAMGSGAHRSQLESHADRTRPVHSTRAHEFPGGWLQTGRRLLPKLRPALRKRIERPEPNENRGNGPIHVHHRGLGGCRGMKPALADTGQ